MAICGGRATSPMTSWADWSDEIAAGVRGVPDDKLKDVALMLRSSRLVLTMGNGGSHALASHAAQALMKPSYLAGGAVAAVCLSDAVPTLTAHANDGGWDNALRFLAAPYLRSTTTLLAFSSSGKSENIIRAVDDALKAGCRVIAFTGFGGGPLSLAAHLSVHVESTDYEVVEPVHDALLHRVQYHLRS